MKITADTTNGILQVYGFEKSVEILDFETFFSLLPIITDEEYIGCIVTEKQAEKIREIYTIH